MSGICIEREAVCRLNTGRARRETDFYICSVSRPLGLSQAEPSDCGNPTQAHTFEFHAY